MSSQNLSLARRKFPRIFFNALFIFVLLIAGYLPSLAAGTPATGTTTDQLIIIQGSGAPASSGDYISATGGGLDNVYDYYIEVPPNLSRLIIELYDQDVGGGGDNDNSGNRDAIRSNLNTCVRYQLYTPGEVLYWTGIYGSSNGCELFPSGNSGDAVWTIVRTVNNPANGHWHLRVDMSSDVTTGDDVNAFGIRAHDGTSGAGGTELNVYSDSFFTVGDNINLAERSYTVYPYVTSGCQGRVNDFDWDAVAGHNYGSLSLTSRTGNFTHTNSAMSSNAHWQNTSINPWTSDTSAADYGIWTSRASIAWYNLSGTNNNNFGIVWLNNYASSDNAPTNSPQPNSFRFYFPTDAGEAPSKPYLTQELNTVSGPNPLNPGQVTQLRVTLTMVNPPGSIGSITFNTRARNVRVYVPGGEVLYSGNLQYSQGSISEQPSLGVGGWIRWNPGSIAAGTTATLSYLVDVTPVSAPEKIQITGTPDSNGTYALYRDETGSGRSRANFTFGPLCELRADAESPTAVTLSSFDTRSALGQVELLWETAQEIDTLEFNILRSETLDGDRQVVNETPIQAQAPGGVIGAQYQFPDTTVQIGKAYYYWLEVVNLDGIQLFGPVIGNAGQSFFLPFISRD